MKYFALLTKLGENLIAQATALGTKIELTHMAVGDGGGTLPTPDTNQTKLIAEKRRAAINALFIDERNKNQIIAEQIIPESEGGWWIREIGLFDKTGNLIAVANCPETYKPQLTEGSGRTQSIRMVLIVSHTESVTLKIDPSVVLATREYVNTEITVLDKKIDALSAQMKLDLIKKFDKENISDILGNETYKAPSLHLLTVEIGKLQPKGNYAPAGYSYSKDDSDGRYQPKGNYAPSGDYATNSALNSGLGGKLNITGGTVTGAISVKSSNEAISIQCTNEEIAFYSIKNSNGSRAAYFGYGSPASPDTLQIINSRSNTNVTIDGGRITVNSKELMSIGAYGFGGRGISLSTANDAELLSLLRNVDTPSQIMSSREAASQYFPGNYSASLYARGNDSFTLFAASCFSDDVIVTAGNNAGTRLKVLKLLTSQNLAQELGSSSTVAISQKAVSDSLFGRGKYIDVTSQRSSGVTYTNTTKTPRFISVILTSNTMNPQVNFVVDGVQVAFFYNSTEAAKNGGVCIIPAGSTYSFTANASVKVMELN